MHTTNSKLGANALGPQLTTGPCWHSSSASDTDYISIKSEKKKLSVEIHPFMSFGRCVLRLKIQPPNELVVPRILYALVSVKKKSHHMHA